jgi:beta-phosphoglucomutase family hydrolase
MTFGAIFDWDGVIIDSSRYHEESWERLAKQENKALPPGYFKKAFGKRNENIIPDVLKWTQKKEEIQQLSDLKEILYRRIMSDRGISPLPGVKPFLQMLKKNNIPCCVGSSTPRSNITTALSLLGWENYFPLIIAAEDVSKGKPDPQVFLLAAQTLHLSPDRCIVFEDAFVGIQAAKAGGMKIIAVTTTHPASELSEADVVVNRLDELSITQLKAFFEDKR